MRDSAAENYAGIEERRNKCFADVPSIASGEAALLPTDQTQLEATRLAATSISVHFKDAWPVKATSVSLLSSVFHR